MLYIINLKDKEGRTITALIDAEKESDAREISRKTANHIARKGKSKVLNSKGPYIVGTAVSLELSGLVRKGNKTYGVCLTTRDKTKDIKIDNIKSIMDAIEETVRNTDKIKVEKRIFIRELNKYDICPRYKGIAKINSLDSLGVKESVEVKEQVVDKEDKIIEDSKVQTIDEMKEKYKLKEMKKVYPLTELADYYTFKEMLSDYKVDNTVWELRSLSKEVNIKGFINLTKIEEIKELDKYYTEKEIAGVFKKEEVMHYYKSLSTLSELYKIGELSNHYTLEELGGYYNLVEIDILNLVKYFDLSAVIIVMEVIMTEDSRMRLRDYVKKNKLEHLLCRAELEVIGL